MSSKSTRSKIVDRALKLAGRGNELKSLANELLNDVLRDWALEYKYPSLRKVGSTVTLAAQSTTVSLPSDYGAGMDQLLIGDDKRPLDEMTMDDFTNKGGFPSASAGTGMPTLYYVDREAGLIRFNNSADQAYVVTPIYYKVPDPIDTSAAGDNVLPWFDNDGVLIQGLIQLIYQYKGDEREFLQEQRVERMKASTRRGLIPIAGGSNRVGLARSRFRKPSGR